MFISGTDQIPPMGFDHPITVTFINEEKIPFVNTCSLYITLPRNLKEKEFKEKMDLAILGSVGFGTV